MDSESDTVVLENITNLQVIKGWYLFVWFKENYLILNDIFKR